MRSLAIGGNSSRAGTSSVGSTVVGGDGYPLRRKPPGGTRDIRQSAAVMQTKGRMWGSPPVHGRGAGPDDGVGADLSIYQQLKSLEGRTVLENMSFGVTLVEGDHSQQVTGGTISNVLCTLSVLPWQSVSTRVP